MGNIIRHQGHKNQLSDYMEFPKFTFTKSTLTFNVRSHQLELDVSDVLDLYQLKEKIKTVTSSFNDLPHDKNISYTFTYEHQRDDYIKLHSFKEVLRYGQDNIIYVDVYPFN